MKIEINWCKHCPTKISTKHEQRPGRACTANVYSGSGSGKSLPMLHTRQTFGRCTTTWTEREKNVVVCSNSKYDQRDENFNWITSPEPIFGVSTRALEIFMRYCCLSSVRSLGGDRRIESNSKLMALQRVTNVWPMCACTDVPVDELPQEYECPNRMRTHVKKNHTNVRYPKPLLSNWIIGCSGRRCYRISMLLLPNISSASVLFSIFFSFALWFSLQFLQFSRKRKTLLMKHTN